MIIFHMDDYSGLILLTFKSPVFATWKIYFFPSLKDKRRAVNRVVVVG